MGKWKCLRSVKWRDMAFSKPEPTQCSTQDDNHLSSPSDVRQFLEMSVMYQIDIRQLTYLGEFLCGIVDLDDARWPVAHIMNYIETNEPANPTVGAGSLLVKVSQEMVSIKTGCIDPTLLSTTLSHITSYASSYIYCLRNSPYFSYILQHHSSMIYEPDMDNSWLWHLPSTTHHLPSFLTLQQLLSILLFKQLTAHTS